MSEKTETTTAADPAADNGMTSFPIYAVTVERRLKHPAVLAISEAARRDLFA